jgi:hypothetical protein
MNLAYFPLPIFLLPGGVTKLRVFEQRYIRLVQESAGDIGFVIASPLMAFDPNCAHANWGSWVKIIDFSTGDDGLLHIDVQCQQMVRLLDVTIESDGLKRGNVEVYEHWQSQQQSSDDDQIRLLHNTLVKLFEQNPMLEELYPRPDFEQPEWVLRRWLEVLPLKDDDKNMFVKPDSFNDALDFVFSIVKN